LSKLVTVNNKVELIKNGIPFIDKVKELITSAKKCIFFHMYIFTYDQSSTEIIELLIQKANEGVDIYFMLDGFGSRDFPQEIIKKLEDNNIHFSFFSPVRFESLNRIGRRLHQKVILIDGQYALVGGTNISKDFIKPNENDPWLDYASIVQGDAIKHIQRKIRRLYLKNYPELKSSIRMLLKLPVSSVAKYAEVKVIENDYTRLKREIQKTYHREIKEAKKSIYITATYFLPGRKLLKLLKKAAARGVEVNLIFGDYSDIPAYNYGSMYFFGWYLKNNINIYKWNKTVIHGKLALIDDSIVNIGSYNHNLISQYANLEMNLEVKDDEFVKSVKKEINQILIESEKVDLSAYEVRSISGKFKNWLFYLFSSAIDFTQILFITRK
tara:strand:- start:26165 stop:27313 length:1149 start_codon:yes stop_codon:yes gene_type:complete